MKRHERIEINPEIMFGKPVIKGTRITVELILRKLAGGMSPEEILQDHPHLKLENIFDAQEFAADYLGQEDIIFASGNQL
ncbi:MAG TPA: antitoxin [Candidatus Atribacteria bacterium]|nr:antitoxin [Candidatus Atribacteria bacterium]HCU21956.1 antitoxin [Candidatus Atribacteria bacterium]